MKHPHAELMMQYAQDAMETDKPWERWQVLNLNKTEWRQLSMNPNWYEDFEYRRKPLTININGFEVPEPVREELKSNSKFCIPSFVSMDFYINCFWQGSSYDLFLLKNGFVHLDKESAIIHAKALLSFTERKK